MSYQTTLDFRLDLSNASGTIIGYASVFNVLDEGKDIVHKGAFKQTILENKAAVAEGKQKYLAPMLYQHDPNKPIGGWTDLEEDNYGLKCTGQMLLTIGKGAEVWLLLKDGIINGLSIGYDVQEGGSSYEKGARNLTKLRLWEISPVTFPMCIPAKVTSVKAKHWGVYA